MLVAMIRYLACHTYGELAGKPAASIAVRVRRVSPYRRTDRVPQAVEGRIAAQ